MRTATTNVYQLHELSEKAKDKAREWWKSHIDSSDFEPVAHEIKAVAQVLGFEEEVQLYWSVGYSQSDHASLEGKWNAPRHPSDVDDACKRFPEDMRLSEIVAEFKAITIECPDAMAYVDERHIIRSCEMDEDCGLLKDGEDHEDYVRRMMAHEARLKEAVKDFNRWAYRMLREHDEFLNSDEEVDEAIKANEYEFTADGTFWSQK